MAPTSTTTRSAAVGGEHIYVNESTNISRTGNTLQGRRFNQTAQTDANTMSISGGRCEALLVKNTGSNDLLVSAAAPHGDDDYDTIEPGDTRQYEGEITTAGYKASLGTTTFLASATRGNAQADDAGFRRSVSKGVFAAGTVAGSLVLTFTSDAPSVAAMRGMTLIPTSGRHIGKAIRIRSASASGGTYTVTPGQAIPSGVVPQAGDQFILGLTSQQIRERVA